MQTLDIPPTPRLAEVIDLRAAVEHRAERRVAQVSEYLTLRGFECSAAHIRAHLAGDVVPCASAAHIDVALHELSKPARKRPAKW